MADLSMARNALQDIFGRWGDYLETNNEALSPRDFYERHLTPALRDAGFANCLFDDDKFPALSDLGIDLNPSQELVEKEFLPSLWEPSAVKQKMAGMPLAQFLLAYIWKLGKFREVCNVMAGYRAPAGQDASSAEENAVVMRQFGRHLASTKEPIFDQHTARFLQIHRGMLSAIPFTDLLVSAVDQPCTKKHRTNYVDWWTRSILASKSPYDGLWADRIMFSLGKAAKKLGKRLAKDRESGGSKSAASTKLALARNLMALHPRLQVAEMRLLLMKELDISEGYANICFYKVRRALGGAPTAAQLPALLLGLTPPS